MFSSEWTKFNFDLNLNLNLCYLFTLRLFLSPLHRLSCLVQTTEKCRFMIWFDALYPNIALEFIMKIPLGDQYAMTTSSILTIYILTLFKPRNIWKLSYFSDFVSIHKLCLSLLLLLILLLDNVHFSIRPCAAQVRLQHLLHLATPCTF